ncbi:hypothetical protein IO99_08615 [Clostridium sulfidigenes]|uniref:Uncharacterized protein n=1 Tax=Clostridium sulfidigenes TaxID=318464 RepID=A0A084JCS8_9CLOT|nr:hypothetical protein IO99_08615 [Clostridium sulfidigenes]
MYLSDENNKGLRFLLKDNDFLVLKILILKSLLVSFNSKISLKPRTRVYKKINLAITQLGLFKIILYILQVHYK